MQARLVAFSIIAAGVTWCALSSQPMAAQKNLNAQTERRELMAGVKTWGYQLQRLNPKAIAASPFDLMVIDHAPDRVDSVEMLFKPKEISALKVKPDGSRRLVLAYMSIGEAERYRYYWDETWLQKGSCPAWLGAVNPQWVGNYPVRYWHPEWQKLIFGQSDSYVDRVMAAGFDGIYLDRADVYEEFKSRPTARADMISYLSGLIDHARSINPRALFVMQNAEELLEDGNLRAKLDGAAKESLYFNADKGGEPTPDEDRMASAGQLKAMARSGGKVMVVEYIDSSEKASVARRLAERDKFIIHFTERSLSILSLKGPDEGPRMAALDGAIATPGVPLRAPHSIPVSPCS